MPPPLLQCCVAVEVAGDAQLRLSQLLNKVDHSVSGRQSNVRPHRAAAPPAARCHSWLAAGASPATSDDSIELRLRYSCFFAC